MQRARPTFIVATESFDVRAHYEDCLGNKEEGVGNDRSVWLESHGIHTHCNDKDNRIQLRKEKLIPQTLS